MEQKTKYQYTYFIYPYVVKEQKYNKYMLKLLKNKKCHLQFWEKEKDLDLYQFFLPTIRENMFNSFSFSAEQTRKFEQFDIDMQASLLSKYPCVMFQYDLGQDAQGKAGEENGIFFRVDKIQLICFESGICFFLIKTNIEDSTSFQDVINFNYKFRDIKSEFNYLKDYENIKIQTNTFQDMTTLSDIMEELIGNEEYSKSLDMDTNRFYTYAYTCLEQECWNQETTFEDIQNNVYKYINVLPARDQSDYSEKQMPIISDGKYIKIGITKMSCNLIASGIHTRNYTKLPFTYEHEYLYTYLLALYKKFYLKKVEKEYQENTRKTSKKFLEFINQLWKHEITNDEMGSLVYDKIHKTLELDQQFLEVKNKYDLMCKELKMEKTFKMNKMLFVLFIISILLNIMNLIILLKK